MSRIANVIKCGCGKILAMEEEAQHGDLVLWVNKIRIPGGGDPWPYLICDCGKTTALTLANLEEETVKTGR